MKFTFTSVNSLSWILILLTFGTELCNGKANPVSKKYAMVDRANNVTEITDLPGPLPAPQIRHIRSISQRKVKPGNPHGECYEGSPAIPIVSKEDFAGQLWFVCSWLTRTPLLPLQSRRILRSYGNTLVLFEVRNPTALYSFIMYRQVCQQELNHILESCVEKQKNGEGKILRSARLTWENGDYHFTHRIIVDPKNSGLFKKDS